MYHLSNPGLPLLRNMQNQDIIYLIRPADFKKEHSMPYSKYIYKKMSKKVLNIKKRVTKLDSCKSDPMKTQERENYGLVWQYDIGEDFFCVFEICLLQPSN